MLRQLRAASSQSGGKRYELEALLCAIVLSMLAGANSLRKVEAFIDERLERLNRLLGTNWRKAPSWVGIRRFLLEIDENELESAIRAHAHAMASPPVGRQFVDLHRIRIPRICIEY